MPFEVDFSKTSSLQYFHPILLQIYVLPLLSTGQSINIQFPEYESGLCFGYVFTKLILTARIKNVCETANSAVGSQVSGEQLKSVFLRNQNTKMPNWKTLV